MPTVAHARGLRETSWHLLSASLALCLQPRIHLTSCLPLCILLHGKCPLHPTSCAGIGERGDLFDAANSGWQATLDVDLTAVVIGVRCACHWASLARSQPFGMMASTCACVQGGRWQGMMWQQVQQAAPHPRPDQLVPGHLCDSSHMHTPPPLLLFACTPGSQCLPWAAGGAPSSPSRQQEVGGVGRAAHGGAEAGILHSGERPASTP